MATASVAKPSDSIAHTDVDDMMVDAHPAEESSAEEDLYTQLKTLQRQLEFYEIQVRAPPGLASPRPSLSVLLPLHMVRLRAVRKSFRATLACRH